MITFSFGEQEVFLYNAEQLSVYSADGNAGWNYTSRIQFNSINQLSHFKEMLEFIEEKYKPADMKDTPNG